MFNYLIHLIPEMISKSKVNRIPEPMLMTGPEQVKFFLDYGNSPSSMLAAYIFHALNAADCFSQSKKVLDLGCGSGSQLIFLAELTPHVQYFGVDLSANMLSEAEKQIKDRNIKNVILMQDDISSLKSIASNSMDGVFSTVAIHHLPDDFHLEKTFQNVSRVLSEKKAMYITDFCLLKKTSTMEFFVDLNLNQPPIFREDYLNSLKAAFPNEKILELQKTYLPWAEFYQTFMIPILFLIKSKSHPIDLNLNHLTKIVESMPANYQNIIRDMYYFFKLSGYSNNKILQLLKKGK